MKINIDNDLYLKTLDMSDVDYRFKVIEENRTFLRQWLGWLDRILTVKDLENYTNGCIQEEKNKEAYTFGIYYNNIFVGVISIKDISYSNKKAEIGYWLEEKSNGNGIMTRSCKVILDYCFNELNLNRVQILVATENYQSQAIPKKLNFEKEGMLKDNECLYGKYIDNYIYCMLNRKWKS